MKKRFKPNYKKAKRSFSKTAQKKHWLNNAFGFRGGIRL